jgi:hypothetical protein
MGKKDGGKAAAAPQIDQSVVNRIANPPQRGVDSNLSALVRSRTLKGSIAAKVEGMEAPRGTVTS